MRIMSPISRIRATMNLDYFLRIRFVAHGRAKCGIDGDRDCGGLLARDESVNERK
uniref:Uncharacterized protein n=1 Tax=Lepeophtheirus salmonis TaxID=72036 RepID=A0A0K2TPI9_LEPSM